MSVSWAAYAQQNVLLIVEGFDAGSMEAIKHITHYIKYVLSLPVADWLISLFITITDNKRS